MEPIESACRQLNTCSVEYGFPLFYAEQELRPVRPGTPEYFAPWTKIKYRST